MRCEKCSEKAISTQPVLCKTHFDTYILETVKETIKQFELFLPNDNICVAVSGGKDSLALLDILTRLGYKVTGLFIDEGIKNYRKSSENDLDSYAIKHNLTIQKVRFENSFNFTLDQAMDTKKFHACTICGTFRRYLLNEHGKKFSVLATGHNMDDEAQTILINLARGNTELLFRQGPITAENKLFVKKVKPFYFISEKQVLTYTYLREIPLHYGECPYAFTSYRAHLRDILNKEEQQSPGTKKNVINTYLQLKKQITPSKKTTFSHQEDWRAHELAKEVQEVLYQKKK